MPTNDKKSLKVAKSTKKTKIYLVLRLSFLRQPSRLAENISSLITGKNEFFNNILLFG